MYNSYRYNNHSHIIYYNKYTYYIAYMVYNVVKTNYSYDISFMLESVNITDIKERFFLYLWFTYIILYCNYIL